MPTPISSGAASGANSPVILPFVEGDDAVRQRVDLIELRRDQQDRPAGGLLVEDLAPHELDRTDVETAGGLRGDQEPRVGLELAGQDQLLLVPPRQRVSR